MSDPALLAIVRAGRERVQYALQRASTGRFECVKRREHSAEWKRVWRLYDDEGRSVETAMARIRHQHRPQDVTTMAAGRQWLGERVG